MGDTSGQFAPLVGIGFPIAMVVFWLAITTLLGFRSGWFDLQRRYPAPIDDGLLSLRMQSGQMGGTHIRNALILSAHKQGLGVGIFVVMGPFQRSFLVPWQDITAEPVETLFLKSMRLTFRGGGTLVIPRASWDRLRNAL